MVNIQLIHVDGSQNSQAILELHVVKFLCVCSRSGSQLHLDDVLPRFAINPQQELAMIPVRHTDQVTIDVGRHVVYQDHEQNPQGTWSYKGLVH